MNIKSLISRVISLAVSKILDRIDTDDVHSDVVNKLYKNMSDDDSLQTLQEQVVDRIFEETDMDQLSSDVSEKVDWSEHIDYASVASELDYSQLSGCVEASDVADALDIDQISSAVADVLVEKLDVDYVKLGQHIDYAALGKHFSALDALAGTPETSPDPSDSESVDLKAIPKALVERLLDRAVEALLLAANAAVEAEEK